MKPKELKNKFFEERQKIRNKFTNEKQSSFEEKFLTKRSKNIKKEKQLLLINNKVKFNSKYHSVEKNLDARSQLLQVDFPLIIQSSMCIDSLNFKSFYEVYSHLAAKCKHIDEERNIMELFYKNKKIVDSSEVTLGFFPNNIEDSFSRVCTFHHKNVSYKIYICIKTIQLFLLIGINRNHNLEEESGMTYKLKTSFSLPLDLVKLLCCLGKLSISYLSLNEDLRYRYSQFMAQCGQQDYEIITQTSRTHQELLNFISHIKDYPDRYASYISNVPFLLYFQDQSLVKFINFCQCQDIINKSLFWKYVKYHDNEVKGVLLENTLIRKYTFSPEHLLPGNKKELLSFLLSLSLKDLDKLNKRIKDLANYNTVDNSLFGYNSLPYENPLFGKEYLLYTNEIQEIVIKTAEMITNLIKEDIIIDKQFSLALTIERGISYFYNNSSSNNMVNFLKLKETQYNNTEKQKELKFQKICNLLDEFHYYRKEYLRDYNLISTIKESFNKYNINKSCEYIYKENIQVESLCNILGLDFNEILINYDLHLLVEECNKILDTFIHNTEFIEAFINYILEKFFPYFNLNTNILKSEIILEEEFRNLQAEMIARKGFKTINGHFFTPQNILTPLLCKITLLIHNNKKLVCAVYFAILLNKNCIDNRGTVWNRLFSTLFTGLSQKHLSFKILLISLNDDNIDPTYTIQAYKLYIKFKSQLSLLNNDECQISFHPFNNMISLTQILDRNTKKKNSYFSHRCINFDSITDKTINRRIYFNEKRNKNQLVEELALDYYSKSHNLTGIHAENDILVAIFNIFFYDIIYKSDGIYSKYFFSIYQTLPIDFYNNFYSNRKDMIDERIKKIANMSTLEIRSAIDVFFSQKRMHLCPFINWTYALHKEDLLKTISTAFGGESLSNLFKVMCINLLKSGFPDLFLWNKNQDNNKISKSILICEVKSHNDKISENQIWWIGKLVECKVKVEICHVLDSN